MRRAYFVVPAVVLALAVGAVMALRLTTTPPTKNNKPPLPGAEPITSDSVRDTLRKVNDLESCQSSIQLLNGFLEQSGEQRLALTKEEQVLLTNEFHLDQEELTEVARSNFTALDAHHLEFSFLLRDALRGLHAGKLAPLDQAAAGFAWAMRQIRSADRQGDSLPPHFVLRRGWGTAQERALAFLAVLEQFGIDGCMIAIPGGERGDAGLRYWIPGALIGKDIYLFDTRLGMALPGPKGQGIATLAQARKDPELLKRLTVDAHFPYDVTQSQAKQTEIHVACSLSALAPRMRSLQQILAAGDAGGHLGVDVLGLWQRFQAAVKSPDLAGTRLRVWNLPGDINTPMRALRYFLPPLEGGMNNSSRRELAKIQLVPWEFYPKPLTQITGLVGERTKELFANPFVAFSLEPRLSAQLLALWLPGLAQSKQEGPANGGMHRAAEVLVRDRMPRDLELRGRFEEATTLLVAIRGELNRQRAVLNAEPEADKRLEEWCRQAASAARSVALAQEALRNPRRATEAANDLARAKEQLNALDASAGRVLPVVQAAAAEPMGGEVVYLLAQCKHEQAERMQARLQAQSQSAKTSDAQGAHPAWKSAAEWWRSYLNDYPKTAAAPAARLQLARALQALGQRTEAEALLLENLSGSELTGLEKTARLYLAAQLKNP